ncbi:MAG: FG-GAP-like repeat-containing protein [Myxococcota bacterium]
MSAWILVSVAHAWTGSGCLFDGDPDWLLTGTPGAYLGTGIAVGDLDGDGDDELVIGRVQEGDLEEVWVLDGTPSGPGPVADAVLPGGVFTGFGYDLEAGSDVNGDGFGDLLVGAPWVAGPVYVEAGAVSLYPGGPSGVGARSDWQVLATFDLQHLPSVLGMPGDVDGDGFDDVLVGVNREDADSAFGDGWVRLFGGATGAPETTPFAELDRDENGFPDTVASPGDVDGDGRADLLVGTTVAVHLYLGRAGGISAQPVSSLPMDGRWPDFLSTGDVDGDGATDLLVTDENYADEEGRVWLHRGRSGDFEPAPIWQTAGVENSQLEGRIVGDVDGDGFVDLVVAFPREQPGGGRLALYLGGPDGPSLVPDGETVGPGDEEDWGMLLSSGDLNGDGLADVVTTAYGVDQTGGVAVWFGERCEAGPPDTSDTAGPPDPTDTGTPDTTDEPDPARPAAEDGGCGCGASGAGGSAWVALALLVRRRRP